MRKKTATESEIKVSNNTTGSELYDDIITVVDASKLSLDDEFMKYDPLMCSDDSSRAKNMKKRIKNELETIIKSGIKDFYVPKIDPSFTKENSICFKPGVFPAVGASYNDWEKLAEDFCPERNSRLGTYKEYVAFIGVLLKRLVISGKSVERAWFEVCNDSKDIGNYKDFSRPGKNLEPTMSRGVCGFYDLANVAKILAWDEKDECFRIASGDYYSRSIYHPIAHSFKEKDRTLKDFFSVGWIVLD